MLDRHQSCGGSHDELIYLSLGESWEGPPAALREALGRVAPYEHGYILTPYGLPALQDALRTYIPATHGLDPRGLHRDYDVAVSQSSTRSAMFDFGRLLRLKRPEGRPVLVCSTPGWDYPGVYASPSLGFEVRRFTLPPEHGYQPEVAEVAEILRRARRDTDGPVLLAINAQHNPTGADWSPQTVRAMIRAALATGACLLLDDAYYAVHAPGTTPTSAPAILLDELAALPEGDRPLWLGVRSLGKQFRCNGWGIGAATAAPATLEALAQLLTERSYVTAVPAQAAMAAWLADDACDAYLEAQRAAYEARRRQSVRLLADVLGYPPHGYVAGRCGAYLLARIPPAFDVPGTDFRELVLRRCGVLLGEAHMSSPGTARNASGSRIRVYLGGGAADLDEAITRMAKEGLMWDA
ncbi:pyridoxal phosphate-dependent aminotransferase [Streptomyces sp. 184]|uniref:pyridoxal phosphate-dependent aminotransferase n=1 Tax=Streptomyces sp. 184 TaxID=1827526 RepID=UPI00389154F9